MIINNRPLSLKEIKQLINILKLNNLEAGLYNNLNFNNNKNKIILLQSETQPLYGHYFCYYNNMFFDPSGNVPGQLWIKYNLNNSFQDANNLINYFNKFNQFDYNDFNYQKNLNSQTCGIHCLARIYWYNQGIKLNDDYKKFLFLIKKKYNYKNFDDLIIDLMNCILKND